MNVENRRRPFEFAGDTFSFSNELLWEYRFDAASGQTSFLVREPRPTYTHRCFVLARTARQFLYHARFDAAMPPLAAEGYRELIRKVIRRPAWRPCRLSDQLTFPGFANLRAFSVVHEDLLKRECGGAWRSYTLRSHWRMVLPISRQHQIRTADGLLRDIENGCSPFIHLVTFPSLTINHGMVLFAAHATPFKVEFSAYDPNDSRQPTCLTYDREQRAFFLPGNLYWVGGQLNIIEIYRSLWM